MPFTTDAKNAMLDGTYAPPTHVAIFSGDPAGSGTQIGSRQAVTWEGAAGGEKDFGDPIEFPVGSGQTVTHAATFSAATGGSLIFHEPVTEETFGNDGVYRLTSFLHELTDPA